MDGTLFPINVAPLQSAALAPPHPRGDDELEVGFVFDALAPQRGDDLLRRFLIRDLLFTLAPGVAVGAPRRVMRKKATLHGIREDAAQRSVHALNKQYDVIKGYRADDSYFSFASAFLNNTISLQQLEKAMLLGKLGEQIVAISGKAFARFTFEEAIPAPCDMYYPKKLARDSKAREDFAKEKDRETVLSEKYVLDIIREEWGNEDERLQRIILG